MNSTKLFKMSSKLSWKNMIMKLKVKFYVKRVLNLNKINVDFKYFLK